MCLNLRYQYRYGTLTSTMENGLFQPPAISELATNVYSSYPIRSAWWPPSISLRELTLAPALARFGRRWAESSKQLMAVFQGSKGGMAMMAENLHQTHQTKATEFLNCSLKKCMMKTLGAFTDYNDSMSSSETKV